MSTLAEKSILTDIKKMLGIDEGYDVYDVDITIGINGAFFELYQLGVGPQDAAFEIEGATETWQEFLGDSRNLAAVKNLIYMTVRLDFDPPGTSFAIEAVKRRIDELKWRLKVEAEPPFPVVPPILVL